MGKHTVIGDENRFDRVMQRSKRCSVRYWTGKVFLNVLRVVEGVTGKKEYRR
jgi:hypothetical protein